MSSAIIKCTFSAQCWAALLECGPLMNTGELTLHMLIMLLVVWGIVYKQMSYSVVHDLEKRCRCNYLVSNYALSFFSMSDVYFTLGQLI